MNIKKYLFSKGVAKLVEDVKEKNTLQNSPADDAASIKGES